MKIKRYTVLLALIPFAALAFILMDNGTEITMESNPGDGDLNPSLRKHFELMQLRDPNTGEIPRDIKRRELNFAMTLPGSYHRIKNGTDRIQGNNWRTRGPQFVGGRTRALAMDVRDENIIIAGGVSGGLWRTTDGGQSWIKTTKPGQLHTVSCLVQDTREGKEDIWYAGTGEFWGNSARISGDGVYKTIDGGLSWELIESTSTTTPNRWDNSFDYIWSIAVNPAAPEGTDEVYVSTTSGAIFRSTDGGGSWTSVLGSYGNGYSLFTEITVTSSGVFYAMLSEMAIDPQGSAIHGIYRSTDGLNWTEITPDFMPQYYKRIVAGIAPSDENQVYFIAETPGSGKLTTNSRKDSLWHSLWKFTYVSGDGTGDGGIWENRTDNIPKPEKVRWQMNSQQGYDLLIRVKPDDPDFVILGGVNLYRSTDGFTTEEFDVIGGTCPDPDEECWYFYRYPNHHADLHNVFFLPSNPDVMFTGSDGGVHKTLDVTAERVEWINLNQGYYTTQFYTCGIDHGTEGSTKIIGGLQDNGTLFTYSENINTPWTIPSNGDGLTCLIADGGDIYYTSQNSSSSPVAVKIWRILLDDQGEKLMQTRIDPAGGRDFIWNCPIVLDPNNNDVMYVAGGALVWRNSDLTEIPFEDSKDSTEINWDSLANTRIGPENELYSSGGEMTALDVSTNPANVVYYGTSEGEVFRIDDATEKYPVPVNVTGIKFPRSAFTSCIKVNPDNASEVFVTFSNYSVLSIFHTTDGGENWTPISGNLEEFPNGNGAGPAVLWFEIVEVGDKKLYLAGTSVGLYSTAYIDGQFTLWKQEGSDEIGNMVVKMIDSRDSDSYVAVATHGAGMFDSFITELPEAPQSPTLVSPSDMSRGYIDEAELKWTKVEDAAFYLIEVSQSPDFSEIEYIIDGLEDTSYNFIDIEQGLVDHYWRVFAKNSGGRSEPSEQWSFRSAIGPPQLSYPSDKADSVLTNLTLVWEEVEEAKSYHLQVATNALFLKFFTDTVGLTGTSFEVKGLEYDDKYYWRLSSIDDDAEGIFSDSWSFRTTDVVSVWDSRNLPGVVLKQNYPNPAGTTTRFDFFLPVESWVTINIYDIEGRKTAIVTDALYAPGKHSIPFNVLPLQPGSYFFRLESPNSNETKQLNIVR